MREGVLALLIGVVIVLTLIGQPFLAILVGFVGALGILMSGEGGKKSFEPVEVPPAGGYPGWDFWKKTLEDLGTLAGDVLKTTTKIDVPIDVWGDFWKEKVWKKEGGSDEWVIPGLLEKVDKNVHLVKLTLQPIERLETTLQNMYAYAPESEKPKIEKAMAKVLALKADALNLAKEGKVQKFTKKYQETLKEIEKILSS